MFFAIVWFKAEFSSVVATETSSVPPSRSPRTGLTPPYPATPSLSPPDCPPCVQPCCSMSGNCWGISTAPRCWPPIGMNWTTCEPTTISSTFKAATCNPCRVLNNLLWQRKQNDSARNAAPGVMPRKQASWVKSLKTSSNYLFSLTPQQHPKATTNLYALNAVPNGLSTIIILPCDYLHPIEELWQWAK